MAKIHAIVVDHGTPHYVNLLLRSLISLHSNLKELSLTVLVNGPEDHSAIALYEWSRRWNIQIRFTGYPLDAKVNTHGELLAQEILRVDDCDYYLTIDSDVCFVKSNTIQLLLAELEEDDTAFGVQADWLDSEEVAVPVNPQWLRARLEINESIVVPFNPGSGGTSRFEAKPVDRIHPFCALLRRSDAFVRAVRYLGCSAASTQAMRGARYFNTLALVTEVMRTHGLTWLRSSVGVVHFEGRSWRERDVARAVVDCNSRIDRFPPLALLEERVLGM